MDIDLGVLRLMEREREIPFDELRPDHRAGDPHRLPQAHDRPSTRPPGTPGAARRTRPQDRPRHGLRARARRGGRRHRRGRGQPHDFGRIAAFAAKQVINQRLRDIGDDADPRRVQGPRGRHRRRRHPAGPEPAHDPRRPRHRRGHPAARGAGARRGPTRTAPASASTSPASRSGPKGPSITVSRTHPSLVRKLFALEVPEIASGVVEITALAREAGHRTKIAVRATQPGVNAKGAAIGELGQRVRAVSAELGGEKIDIVDHSDDLPPSSRTRSRPPRSRARSSSTSARRPSGRSCPTTSCRSRSARRARTPASPRS